MCNQEGAMDKDTIKIQRITALLAPLGVRIVSTEKTPDGRVILKMEFESEEKKTTPIATPS